MSAKKAMVTDNMMEVDRILDTKRTTFQNNITFAWAVLFLCMAGMIYLELTYGSMGWLALDDYPGVCYSVHVLMILLLAVGVFMLLKNILSRVFTATLEITTGQQRLCGVADSDPSFRIVSPTSTSVATSATLVPSYSPSIYTGRPSYCYFPAPVQQYLLTPPPSSTPIGSPLDHHSIRGLSPQEIIASSTFGGGSPGFGGRQGSTSYMPSVLNGSYHADLNGTSDSRNSPVARGSIHSSPVGHGSPIASYSVSPGNFSPSYPMRQDLPGGNNVLRARHPCSPPPSKSSPILKSDDLITNAQELESYLQESMNAKELRMTTASHITDMRAAASPASGFSFWSFNRSMLDYIPVIGRYQYQLAPHSVPQSTTSVDSPQHDFSVCPVSEDVWSKLDIDSDQVDQWVENLRKWICRTILNRLIEEIAEVNKALVNIGSEDVQIGEVSLSTLKQWLSAKGQLVPKLSTLIPFLDLSANQEYLVQRIIELGSGGCMSTFKWNSGSDFKGKVWEENLPTDSAIVMHLLCCYMDLRLPSHPKYPDGKTFTCQHFLRAPAKPNLKDRKDHLLIYEVRLHPPHYNVVIEDNVWNVKQGRNNVFHAILLFLHHIKTKEHGMLRRVSLGLSGINILWVFDS